MTLLAASPGPTAPARVGGGTRRGRRELGLLALVYLAYSASRLVADDALAPALGRARWLLAREAAYGMDVERTLNDWFVESGLPGTLAAFHYATAHYVVTAAVLVWLHRRGTGYVVARRALVAATGLALLCYVWLPTAPPRLFGDGYVDLMAEHADLGWWGEAASAPDGLGWMTNQLAAFPSMHAGWALWVALAVSAATTRRPARWLAWSHVVLTGLVVVGTGNHWTLDVLAGWALVWVVWVATSRVRPTGAARRVATTRRTSGASATL